MPDDMKDDRPPWYAPDHHRPGIPRQRTPGEVVWRLRHPDGHVHACELRNNSAVTAGWEVTMLADGELMFSRRCVDESHARYVATAWRQDTSAAGSSKGSNDTD
jgi:hypothetical protein